MNRWIEYSGKTRKLVALSAQQGADFFSPVVYEQPQSLTTSCLFDWLTVSPPLYLNFTSTPARFVPAGGHVELPGWRVCGRGAAVFGGRRRLAEPLGAHPAAGGAAGGVGRGGTRLPGEAGWRADGAIGAQGESLGS